MFSMIIQIILTIALFTFSITLIIKSYKDTRNDIEKVLYIMLSFAIIFPLFVFYLDRYNIPSKLGYTENIISSDWTGILTNYSSVIFSALFSAAFLVFITFKQIDETYKDNMKLNNETHRLQNLPLLRYSFINDRLKKLSAENQKLIFSNQDSSNHDDIDFIMEIENIGLNTVRKLYLEVESELFDKKQYFELCNQSNIAKEQKKNKEIIITNVGKGRHKIEIIVYYQDLLKNWYKQKIHLIISVTNRYSSKTHDCSQINSVVVDDEEMLLKEPIFIKKIKKK